MKRMIRASVSWSYFDRFSDLIHKYMPSRGEGDTQASQAATAVNKLIYRWYNDGDVYDNTYYENYGEDQSSYANWLYKYVPESRGILTKDFMNSNEYEEILKNLADAIINEDVLYELDQKDKVDSIYSCEGQFRVEEYDDDDWDDEDY